MIFVNSILSKDKQISSRTKYSAVIGKLELNIKEHQDNIELSSIKKKQNES